MVVLICRTMMQDSVGALSTHGAREYLHVSTVLNGLRKIVKRSFGVDMQEVPLAPGRRLAGGEGRKGEGKGE
jgi:hypothetical protein